MLGLISYSFIFKNSFKYSILYFMFTVNMYNHTWIHTNWLNRSALKIE